MYDMELTHRRHLYTHDKMHPHMTLSSDRELQKLTEAWMSHNKSRVYANQKLKQLPTQSPCNDTAASLQVAGTQSAMRPSVHVTPSTPMPLPTTSPYVLASLRKVVSSRMDLPSVGAQIPSSVGVQIPSSVGVQLHSSERVTVPTHSISPDHLREMEYENANTMAKIERQLILLVLEGKLKNGSTGSKDGLSTVSNDRLSTVSKDPVAHACCAYITTTDRNGVVIKPAWKIYLPIAAPSPEQVKECTQHSYNKTFC